MNMKEDQTLSMTGHESDEKQQTLVENTNAQSLVAHMLMALKVSTWRSFRNSIELILLQFSGALRYHMKRKHPNLPIPALRPLARPDSAPSDEDIDTVRLPSRIPP